MSTQWSGSLRIGLTTMAISDTTSPALVPPSADQITSKVTWVVTGAAVLKCGQILKENYAPALERVQVGDCWRSGVLWVDGWVDGWVCGWWCMCLWVDGCG